MLSSRVKSRDLLFVRRPERRTCRFFKSRSLDCARDDKLWKRYDY
jgi:hypothetical protein